MSKKCWEDKHIKLSLVGEAGKRHPVLIKYFNSIHLYMVEENIFIVIVHKLLKQQKYWNAILKTVLKINGKQRIKIPKKVNIVDSKIMEEKQVMFMIYAGFERILVP